ncbi:hypothetical protein [Amycolatopsis pigmentata]|uniref:Secreted protein n=1 Tax=Amycolatopsis pigmentata TaxID=450801 RepID=A0ABW5FNQ2_9PSEU
MVVAFAAALLVPAGTAMAATAPAPTATASANQVKPADCATDGTDVFVLVQTYVYPGGVTYWYEDEYGDFFPSPVYEGPYFIAYCA